MEETHGRYLFESFHIHSDFVLFLNYSSMMHSMKIPLFTKFVPCGFGITKKAILDHLHPI